MKPILFSTEMVKAILAGRKTQTRRVIKPKYTNTEFEMLNNKQGKRLIEAEKVPPPVKNADGTTKYTVRACTEVQPKYKIGDILWVRETWRPIKWANKNPFVYKADWTNEELEQAKHVTIDPKLGYRKNPWI